MRLRELQQLLHHGILLINQVNVSAGLPNNRTQIGHLREVRQGLGLLRRIPPLGTEVAPLLNSPYITNSMDDILLLDAVTASNMVQQLEYLNVVASRVLAFINATLPAEPEMSVSFRVPDTTSVKDLAGIVDELNLIFSQTLQPTAKYGAFTLLGFDTGTMWINIGLDTLEAVILILSLTGAAGWFYRARAKNEEQKAEALRHVEKERVAMIDDLFTKMLASKRTEAIERLLPNAENEDRARLGAAIDKYVKMIERGGEITPALGAPVEIRKAFEEERKLLGAAGPPRLLLAETTDAEVEVDESDAGEQSAPEDPTNEDPRKGRKPKAP